MRVPSVQDATTDFGRFGRKIRIEAGVYISLRLPSRSNLQQHCVAKQSYPDGTKWSVLEGDKDAPGKAFIYAFYIPAGNWGHHSHNQDARVAVASGALKVAIGPKLDKERAKAYPVGSFLLVPANVEHTMGADVDTIIIGTALGPWKTHHDEEMHHGGDMNHR
jgi:quercetin dioxygenase-like cupin family protein